MRIVHSASGSGGSVCVCYLCPSGAGVKCCMTVPQTESKHRIGNLGLSDRLAGLNAWHSDWLEQARMQSEQVVSCLDVRRRRPQSRMGYRKVVRFHERLSDDLPIRMNDHA